MNIKFSIAILMSVCVLISCSEDENPFSEDTGIKEVHSHSGIYKGRLSGDRLPLVYDDYIIIVTDFDGDSIQFKVDGYELCSPSQDITIQCIPRLQDDYYSDSVPWPEGMVDTTSYYWVDLRGVLGNWQWQGKDTLEFIARPILDLAGLFQKVIFDDSTMVIEYEFDGGWYSEYTENRKFVGVKQ